MFGSKPVQGFAGGGEDRRQHADGGDAPGHSLQGCPQSGDTLLNGRDVAPEAGLHAGDFRSKARAHVIHGLSQSRESSVHFPLMPVDLVTKGTDLAAQLTDVLLSFIEAVAQPVYPGFSCFDVSHLNLVPVLDSRVHGCKRSEMKARVRVSAVRSRCSDRSCAAVVNSLRVNAARAE